MHIGRPCTLNTPSFLILFRSALFKAARLSAEGNPCSINGVSGATFTLITMKSGLARLLQETWSMSHNTQHGLHQIQDREGKRQGLPSPANFLLTISSTSYAEHLSLQILRFVLLSPAFLYYHHEEPLWQVCNCHPNGSISVAIPWGRNDHSTPGK